MIVKMLLLFQGDRINLKKIKLNNVLLVFTEIEVL